MAKGQKPRGPRNRPGSWSGRNPASPFNGEVLARSRQDPAAYMRWFNYRQRSSRIPVCDDCGSIFYGHRCHAEGMTR